MPRCKHCRELFDNPKFLQKFCRTNIDCKTAEGMYNLDKKKKAKEKKFKDWKEEVRPRTHKKENKAELQKQINLLARNIDKKYGYVNCIDCGILFGKQIDGGHFNSVGSNSTLRFNLHNIHSQNSNCNRNGMGGGKQLGYFRGLEKRYGSHYAEYIEVGLQKEYLYIGLTEQEIYDKLKLVRAINRTFDTYQFVDALHARDMFNTIIGIYQNQYQTKL